MNSLQNTSSVLDDMPENAVLMPDTDMTQLDHISRVWDIVEKVRIGMLTTQFSGGLRARPLEARVDRDNGTLWFVTDVRGSKDEEIGASHAVGLTFRLESEHAYISITGRAFVTQDSVKSKQIWRPSDNLWFPDGPEDPNVRLLCIKPMMAELWDGPSRAAVVNFKCAQQQA